MNLHQKKNGIKQRKVKQVSKMKEQNGFLTGHKPDETENKPISDETLEVLAEIERIFESEE